ncbi:hypothetical protein V7x_28840 [Crateriforma conspicua]|uniref:Uncharacterized protein n=1 Tax=Crateriforma conspicua TaxID=2527996 RepID=A0A5C6G1D6_9PLAN|nr:hypothetical protein [Crateriforma conspicua]TWU67310.1 hypothetical protein V7x_28840 [Crateriforma conspicua]
MNTLDRSTLENTAKTRFKDVALPGGGAIKIRSITATEKTEYDSIVYNKDGEFEHRRLSLRPRKLLQLCLLNPDGTQMYAPEEVPRIKCDGGVFQTLVNACIKHCGLDQAELSIDDAKKNSPTIDDSARSSGFVSSSESTTPSPGSTAPTPTSSPDGSPIGNLNPSATTGDAPAA